VAHEMQTETEVSPARRHRRIGLWLVAVLALLAIVVVIELRGHPAAATQPPRLAAAIPMKPVPLIPRLAAAAAAETAPPDEMDVKEYQAWLRRVADWLATRDDADAVAAAALLLYETPPRDAARISALLERAANLAPADKRIQAQALLLCGGLEGYDASRYEQAVRVLDPKNALGSISALGRAVRAQDASSADAAFAQLAETDTMNTYWAATLRSLIAQVNSAPVPSSPDAATAGLRSLVVSATFGASSTLPMPPVGPLVDRCRSQVDASTAPACDHVTTAMQSGDTVLANLVGLSLREHLPGLTAAQAADLARQRDQLTSMVRTYGETYRTFQPDAWMRALGDYSSEADMMRAMLNERGAQAE
jgi:hypothetical protein